MTGTTGTPWHLISSPVTTQDIYTLVTTGGNAIAFIDPKYGLGYYDESADGFTTYTTTTASEFGTPGPMTTAKGYEILRTSDGVVSFTGTINTSDVPSYSIIRENQGWNLLGNPYPSAINATAAIPADKLLNSTNVDNLDASYAALYLWDPIADSYKTINNAGGTPTGTLSQDYIQAGQGFFVRAKDATSRVFDITEAMQTHQTDVAFRGDKVVWPGINLIVESEEKQRNTQIVFNAEMTNGLDISYDAGIFKSGTLSLYSRLIEDNGVDFSIQCLPEEYDELVIPIGLDALAGTNLVFSAEINDIPENCTFLLEDNQTGIITELGQNSYTIELDAASNGIGRFYLHTNINTIGIDNLYLHPEETFKIISNSQSGNIQILGTINQATNAKIYDMRGKLITSVQLSRNNENIIPFNNAQNGIYIIRFQSNDRIVSKKFNW